MAAHGEFNRVGDAFARYQRGFHALVAHGDAIGDGDGAEFAGCAAGGGHTALDRLGLAHQGNVAGCGFIPAAGHADEGLVNLLLSQAHGIEVRPMRGALRSNGDMAAREPGF
jgi:hypothetical protein